MELDQDFFDTHGYVVVKRVVPKSLCEVVIAAEYDFLGFNPSKPEGWYQEPLKRGGMLELYQHPALWDTRQHPSVHAAFTKIYDTERLWVSFDRVNFNPPVHPAHPEYDHLGMIHWDIDPMTAHTAPFRVQGVLYLSDTPVERGGFCCVPGHHKLIERWAATSEQVPGAPEEGKRTPKDKSEITIVPITAEAGDLVIWNTRLLHGNGRNLSDQPRLAQYITMSPEHYDNQAEREDRVMRWRERRSPEADWAPGDPRGWEQQYGKTAELTELGKKLLGLEPWN
ncbi:phytanoyl-CoA dioxygenase family protein [Armatimonas sp.]|uniref:phytanoyl-CoA dioxygenase family protein n=1 Tax=Armatimonas sp. TaxID=1872638 RepID=UPI00286C9D04|nr:phytanoyl-CoA dioxygenase family protein [Armatimonas sp.]